MYDKAIVDNKLAAANLAIGESSNLAQLCLSYSYNFNDDRYHKYVCILSVLAQCSIDNAKRAYDVDLNSEIARIKEDMDVKANGYPKFFASIKERNEIKRMKYTGEKARYTKEKYSKSVNNLLECPMNYLSEVKFGKFRSDSPTLSMDYFFNSFSKQEPRRKCKKVEELIEKYSIDLYNHNTSDDEDMFLLRNDFEELIDDIRGVYISKSYVGLMSWLLNRAFQITPNMRSNSEINKSKLMKNKSLLIATLYSINKENLLECFSKNMDKT